MNTKQIYSSEVCNKVVVVTFKPKQSSDCVDSPFQFGLLSAEKDRKSLLVQRIVVHITSVQNYSVFTYIHCI